MCDAMDKCSMTRVHGMVNKVLCSTCTVVSLACSSTPWKMSCVQDSMDCSCYPRYTILFALCIFRLCLNMKKNLFVSNFCSTVLGWIREKSVFLPICCNQHSTQWIVC